MRSAGVRYRPSPYEPLGFGKFVAIALGDGGDRSHISYGEAHFDTPGDEEYPCYAMFLDSSNALLLKEGGPGNADFERIGVAKFLRTGAQRVELPMNADNIIAKRIPYGPAIREWPVSEITIY